MREELCQVENRGRHWCLRTEELSKGTEGTELSKEDGGAGEVTEAR